MRLTCKEAAKIISNEKHKRSLKLRFSLFIHKIICPPCARFAKQLEILNKGFSNYRNHLELNKQSILSETKKQQIQSEINKLT